MQRSGGREQQGIYVDSGDILQKVIDLSDLLDGKTLSSFEFTFDGMSGLSLVFGAVFTDGSVGIFRADAVVAGVPEPTISEPATLALFGLGLTGLGYMRRRRAA